MNGKKVKIIGSIIFSVVYQCLFAQNEIDTSQNILQEVILSASKIATSASKTSQVVQSIPRFQILQLQSQNMADLLQATGGVFIQKSQQGGGSPILRGFEANKVLIVIDGVRMNNAIYRGGHLQNIITLDNQAVDKIEVLNGPGSTLYGSDALGGVIHVYTRNPIFGSADQKHFSGNAMLRYGTSNHEKTAHVSMRFGNTKFATMTSVTASSFGDLKMGKRINPSYGKSFGERPLYVQRINNIDSIVRNDNPYTQRFSGYKQIDILQKISHKLTKNISQSLNIQYSNSSDIPRYDRLTNPGSSAPLRQAEWYYGPQLRGLIAYDIDRKRGDKNDWHIGVHYQTIEESRYERRYRAAFRDSRIENIHIWSFAADKYLTKGNHQIAFGLDGQWNDLTSVAFSTNVNDNTTKPQSTRYPDGDNTMASLGVYLWHSLSINDKWTLNDGLRLGYTSLKSTFINKSFFPFPYDEARQSSPTYSGSIALVYNPTPRFKLSTNLSTGFRAPNIDDLAKVFDSTPSTLVVPNPDITPEKTLTTELNGVYSANNRIQLQAAIFHTSLVDAIVVDKFTFNGQSTIVYNGNTVDIVANQNKSQARIRGFSVGAGFKIINGLRLDLSVQYTKGSVLADSGDKPLDHIPPFISRISLEYRGDKWSIMCYTLYNGWKRLDDYSDSGEDNLQYATADGMPSWYTINLKSSYNISNNIRLMAGIENLLDLQYRTFASGINGSGRNVSVSVLGNF
jgi:hemoglobin/transferrin/lactoferrin receptor protein